MEFDFPSVIVDLDSSQVKAGLSTADTPSVIIPTVYSKGSSGPSAFGDDIDLHPQDDVYTLFQDGLVYNYDQMGDYMRYIYSRLNVSMSSVEEIPLVVAENSWSTKRDKSKALQIAFEELEVPLFSLLRRQVCTAYSLSKPSAVVVVEINDDLVSVTPISNGKVLSKGCTRSRYGGDFLNVFSMNFIEKQLKKGGSTDSVESALVPRPFRSAGVLSDTFKRYQIGTSLNSFKQCTLRASLLHLDPKQEEIPRETQLRLSHGAGTPLEAKNYELPNRVMIKEMGLEQYKLAEPLFRPYDYAKSLDADRALGVPEDSQGIGGMIFSSMKNLGGTGEMYVNLLNNIVLTGSSSYIPQLEQRVVQDLRGFVQEYSINTYWSPDPIERTAETWVGANILTSSSVGDFDHLFVSKEDYNEQGENYALERFK